MFLNTYSSGTLCLGVTLGSLAVKSDRSLKFQENEYNTFSFNNIFLFSFIFLENLIVVINIYAIIITHFYTLKTGMCNGVTTSFQDSPL